MATTHHYILTKFQVGRDWIKTALYDIDAKVDDSLVEAAWKNLSFNQRWDQVMLMLQSLLANRFKLRVRHEMKDLPVYALVLAKNGPEFAEDTSHPQNAGIRAAGRGRFEVTSDTLSSFTFLLSVQPEVGHRVILDKTGLQSHYTFRLQWTPENLAARDGQLAAGASSAESSGPSLFTALQEQLGLKLESTKAAVDTIVIEHIEQPSEN